MIINFNDKCQCGRVAAAHTKNAPYINNETTLENILEHRYSLLGCKGFKLTNLTLLEKRYEESIQHQKDGIKA